jgi:hypothetical protein
MFPDRFGMACAPSDIGYAPKEGVNRYLIGGAQNGNSTLAAWLWKFWKYDLRVVVAGHGFKGEFSRRRNTGGHP